MCVCVLDGCSVSCGGLFPATGLGMVLARISLYGITVCVCVCVLLLDSRVCVCPSWMQSVLCVCVVCAHACVCPSWVQSVLCVCPLWMQCPVCVCVCPLHGCKVSCVCVRVCVLHGCRVSCGDLFPRRWRWLGSGLNQSLPSNWRGFYLRARTDFILRTDPLTSPRRLCSSRTCPMPAARSASRS